MPCTTILVGKNASYDGSTIISRNDDGSFETKKVVVVKPEKQPKKYKSVIGHLEIDLPENPLKYTMIPNVDNKKGLWPAAGINELNVAMTATETITSNPRVVGADPYVRYVKAQNKKEKDIPGGIGEEDLVAIVLPYIKSAREGVVRLGSLLEKYGTYEANGIAFSDENEIWWLESIGGHHWISKKVDDDEVVVMPNQFGLDNFDLEDAFGEMKSCMCSKDLKDFIEQNHLYLGKDNGFNPRFAFGSRTDQDHVYNTPRAWYIERYFCPRTYKWDGPDAYFNPESDDIPWSIKPEKKVTIQDIKYLLSSYYQGTKYNPYGKENERGKYRSIGVPNSDDSAILQIRGYMPDKLKGLEWLSLGGSGFTCSFPIYTNAESFPKYISETTNEVTTEYMYWASRIIAALVDAHYPNNIVFDERYQNAVFNRCQEVIVSSDKKMIDENDFTYIKEANEKIIKIVKEESEKVLKSVLNTASTLMKTKYNRSDN